MYLTLTFHVLGQDDPLVGLTFLQLAVNKTSYWDKI